MANTGQRHARLNELPRGLRRRCVKFAIAMTWLSFCGFLSFIACWTWRIIQPYDNQALVTLALIAMAMGIGHGIRARLTVQIAESRQFINAPGILDFALLALSASLLTAGCCVALVAA